MPPSTTEAFATPVVFFVFNRPQETEQVFAEIRKLRPANLFIVSDGPRANRPGESERCRKVREIVARIDWPCTVRRNQAETNLGCGLRIASGLDWVFAQVEEAIVVEDDCLPDPQFFPYCRELLERYRDDRRIFCVSGFSAPLPNPGDFPDSYYFSRFFGMWGWATWRRAWRHYDFRMRDWPSLRDKGDFASAVGGKAIARQLVRDLDNVYRNNGQEGIVDTWDFQFAFAMLKQDAFCIKPIRSMIANLGVGSPEATHTKFDNALGYVRAAPLGPIRHPSQIAWTGALDTELFLRYYLKSEIAFKIKQQIKRVPALAACLLRLYTLLYTRRKARQRGSELPKPMHAAPAPCPAE